MRIAGNILSILSLQKNDDSKQCEFLFKNPHAAYPF